MTEISGVRWNIGGLRDKRGTWWKHVYKGTVEETMRHELLLMDSALYLKILLSHQKGRWSNLELDNTRGMCHEIKYHSGNILNPI